MKVLPNAFALFKVRLCMTLAPKKDQLSRNAEALFLNDRPFCLLGYKRKQTFFFFYKIQTKFIVKLYCKKYFIYIWAFGYYYKIQVFFLYRLDNVDIEYLYLWN